MQSACGILYHALFETVSHILRLRVYVKCVAKLYCIWLLVPCGRIQCDNNPLVKLRNVQSRVEMFDRTFASVLSNDYWSVHPGFCRRRCALALELGRGTMATTIDIFAAPPRSQLLSRWSFFPASGGNSNCPLDTKCDGPRMSCEFHLV